MKQEMLVYSLWIQSLNDQKEAFKKCNDPAGLAARIREESQELVDEVDKEGEAFGVGREIGDNLYLLFLLCAELGFDPKDLLDITIKRNEEKYPKERLSGDCNQETIKALKQEWKDKGDDVAWSHTLY
jgi:NTP pyrophosphatase (non-canonical NTP hydrolase)